MQVRFWGTRGSIPAALTARSVREKLIAALTHASGRDLSTPEKAAAFADTLPFALTHTFGGNSSCVELKADGAGRVLLDLGSGARAAAGDALRELKGKPGEFHVFMSHLHWDHIMGFPFFTPAYIPGHTIRIHGCHAELEHAFRRQQDPPSFPVGFAMLGAKIEFTVLEPGRTYEIAGYRVTPKAQAHGGGSYGYRFERDGRAVVYTTDSEHKLENAEETESFIEFFRDADLVIFDAMYSLADAISVKEDWGHSSNVVGVELCQLARVKHLVLFHHEPAYDDATIERVWRETQRLEEITRGDHAVKVTAAYDGLEVTL
ncbi:MAG TPA: MBL fold metallo-hydrolase [Burkholderiales bacterium]|nr:MBL fold metallo-hydrolase [Burkholderiales bacterium]